MNQFDSFVADRELNQSRGRPNTHNIAIINYLNWRTILLYMASNGSYTKDLQQDYNNQNLRLGVNPLPMYLFTDSCKSYNDDDVFPINKYLCNMEYV